MMLFSVDLLVQRASGGGRDEDVKDFRDAKGNATQLTQDTHFSEMSCLGWDSNPHHSAFQPDALTNQLPMYM